jgi:hypothetical protein
VRIESGGSHRYGVLTHRPHHSVPSFVIALCSLETHDHLERASRVMSRVSRVIRLSRVVRVSTSIRVSR